MTNEKKEATPMPSEADPLRSALKEIADPVAPSTSWVEESIARVLTLSPDNVVVIARALLASRAIAARALAARGPSEDVYTLQQQADDEHTQLVPSEPAPCPGCGGRSGTCATCAGEARRAGPSSPSPSEAVHAAAAEVVQWASIGFSKGVPQAAYPWFARLRDAVDAPVTDGSGAADTGREPLTHVAIVFRKKCWSLPAPYRHHDIIRMIVWLDPSVTNVDVRGPCQGFLDASGQYLTRRQAQVSAEVNGQIKNGKIIGGELTSEDLW